MHRLPSVLIGEEDSTPIVLAAKRSRHVRLPSRLHCGCTLQPRECPPCRREREDAEEAQALERLREIGALA